MKKLYYILLFFLIVPISVFSMELPSMHSKNILLYDPESNEVLYEKGADEVINIASLTKIMTTITAIENIKDLNEVVTITDTMLNEVPYDASVAGLKVGDKVTYLDLLYASILPSGADATTALGYGIAGSTQEFINLMNAKAQELNLTNTHFANVTGYDIANHYSTPREVLQLLLYALKNDLFKQIYETKNYTLTNGLEVEATIFYYNQNNIYDLSPIIGSKTGFTSKAGLCMSSIIDVKDKNLILLTFGAPRIYGTAYNIDDALTVVKFLNENYEEVNIVSKNEEILSLPIEYSKEEEYKIYPSNDISIYISDFNKENFSYEYDGVKTLNYKYKKGDKLGTITYHYLDKTFTEDVFLTQNINLSLTKYLTAHLNIVIPICLLLIIIYLFLNRHKHYHKKHNTKRNF